MLNLRHSEYSIYLRKLFNYSMYLQLNEYRASKEEDSSLAKAQNGVDSMVHIVSWIDCVDLRLLAVLANSTLSSSRLVDIFIITDVFS